DRLRPAQAVAPALGIRRTVLRALAGDLLRVGAEVEADVAGAGRRRVAHLAQRQDALALRLLAGVDVCAVAAARDERKHPAGHGPSIATHSPTLPKPGRHARRRTRKLRIIDGYRSRGCRQRGALPRP